MTRRAAEEPGSETIRVIMTKSMPGSEDGIRINRYGAGEAYELGEALATSFIGSKVARPAPDQADQTDKKDKKDQTNKKAAKGPDENK